MVLFDDFIYWLDYYSVADVLLPFILIFTVVYAILQKSKILGDESKSKNFNIVVAIVMGFAVVIPHVLGLYPGRSVVDIINAALPQVSLIVVAIIMFLLLVGIFAKEVTFAGQSLGAWAVLFSLVVIFVIFGAAAEWFYLPNFLQFLYNPEVQSLIIIILVFGVIIAFVTSDPKKKDEKKLAKNFKDLFGGVLGK